MMGNRWTSPIAISVQTSARSAENRKISNVPRLNTRRKSHSTDIHICSTVNIYTIDTKQQYNKLHDGYNQIVQTVAINDIYEE